MSTVNANPQKRHDLSLTLIYQALQKPTSSASIQCRNDLHTASIKQLDYTLRKLKSYSKQSQWPSRRLIRCLYYIFIHGIKPSSQLQDLVQLASLKACVRWVFTITASDNDDEAETTLLITSAVKFICALLETIASQLPDSVVTVSILSDIKYHDGAKTLLSWSQKTSLSIRIYSVRALTANLSFFAKDLIALDAYTVLSQSLLEIPSFMNMLILKPPVTDASQKRSELEQSIMTSRLLESLFKYEQLNPVSPARVSFADSNEFSQLVKVWHQVCHLEYNTLINHRPPLKIKNGQLLIYSLTAIIQKGTSISQKAATLVTGEGSRSKWTPYLTLIMQRWIHGTCCTMNIAVMTPETLNTEKSIMKKLVQITLDMVSVLKHHMYWLDYVDQTICDLTNFFMAFISLPILPEQAVIIGTALTLVHTNICIDVEERGFQLTGDMLNQHQDLLVLLFESFIQHVQLATPHFIELISGRVAWCLKSMLTILLNANQLETSGLGTRITKLIVFFLHYYDAIDILATSTTSITPFVWGPTIDMAKKGLMTAAKSSPTSAGLKHLETNMIYKAKRAFVSLQMISNHPRACERLMDCNVLQLVDIAHIPSGDVMEKTHALLKVYALFGRLIATLSRRTAFVRTRLRDEYGLFPMIIKLLQEAIERKDAREQEDSIWMGWHQVISSCLMVISSFQYDESSTRMWLSWKLGEEDEPVSMKMEDDSVRTKDEQVLDNNNRSKTISVLPAVLSILFPWRKYDNKCLVMDITLFLKSKEHHQLVILAAQVLDQLSGVPLCGKQIIMDQSALSNLSTLMVALTTAIVCREENEVVDPIECQAMVICKNKSDSSESTEGGEDNDIAAIVGDYMDVDQGTGDDDSNSNKPTTEESLNFKCAAYLRRSAIRMLICHDNIQFTILSDAFTTFFKPMLQHPSMGSSHEHWRRAICNDLYEKKFGDFMSLYKFTETASDNSIKLHEFTAVAVGYSTIGAQTDEDWNTALGLTVSEGIVSTKHVFGVFCQMLVYELEEEPKADSLLTFITPFRRNAAAQVIETLALEQEMVWRVETGTIQDDTPDDYYMPLNSPAEMVYFVTDDSSSLISGNRQLLCARSPIFEALLSSHYAEESNYLAASKAIPLHDVTFHSLKLFISVIHQMHNDAEDVLDVSVTPWKDIVDLLFISDRFGSEVVKNKCEHWVLNRVKHLHHITKQERKVCLEGMLGLYRHCRNPMEQDGGIMSNTWPFATLLTESLKAIVQYLSESCQTQEFINMVQDKNREELDAFCDGVAFLLKK